MVVCPVCEHPQAGGPECEVCGRRFEEPLEAALADSVPVLDVLESTRRSPVGAVQGELVPGLEHTGAEPVQVAAEPLIAELEQTARTPVDPPIEATPGVERVGDDAPVEERTPYPAVVVCRYCRTEAVPGEKLCSRCGMRLSTVAALPPLPAEGAAAVRLCSCGTPIGTGARCPACGARTPQA